MICTWRYNRKCYAVASKIICKLKGFSITGTDEIIFTMFSVDPSWSHSMNNILCRKIKCGRTYCAANGNSANLLTFGKKFTSTSCQVYWTVYSTCIYWIRVCRIDYCISFNVSYISTYNMMLGSKGPSWPLLPVDYYWWMPCIHFQWSTFKSSYSRFCGGKQRCGV